MRARYQDGDTARFLSIDPLFISLGFADMLTNPQRMNSYGYALNNPIIYDDPTGESASFSSFLGFTVPRADNLSGGYIRSEVDAYQQAGQTAVDVATSPQAQTAYTAVGLTGLTLAAPQLGVPANLARSMAVAGNGNLAFNVYVDMQDGTYDSTMTDNVLNFGEGAGFAATGVAGKAAPVIFGTAAASFESRASNGNWFGPEVAGAGAGAGLLYHNVSTPALAPKTPAGALIQGGIELGVGVILYESLDNDEDESNN